MTSNYSIFMVSNLSKSDMVWPKPSALTQGVKTAG